MGKGVYTAIATVITEEMDLTMASNTLGAARASDKLYGNPNSAFR